MNLWMVVQYVEADDGKVGSAEFQGIFDSHELAKQACRKGSYAILPVVLNRELPDESVPWLKDADNRHPIFIVKE